MVALLVLTVLLISRPEAPWAALHNDAGPFATHHVHMAQVMTDTPLQTSHGSPAADCEATLSGCCAMAHCQPVLSVNACEIAVVAAADKIRAATPRPGCGRDPAIILPPPREASD